MTIYRDFMKSKVMQRHPTRAYFLTRGPTGIGKELFDLRKSLDDVAFDFELGLMYPKLVSMDLVGPLSIAAGASGAKLYIDGVEEGYEKATYRWVYAPGKELIVTAVKPGEIGNLIEITFASAAADGVTCEGNKILIEIDNDGATVPADLQTLVAADRKISQLIKITSTDATAIPDAFALAGPSAYLQGGTGLGWGAYVSSTWENDAGIVLRASGPGLSPAKYEVEWKTGGAAPTPVITATRKRTTITYQAGATTAAHVRAALLANPIASEHILPMVTGAGTGFVAEPNSRVVMLGEDQGFSCYIERFQADLIEVASTYVTINIPAAANIQQPVLARVQLLAGLLHYGSLQVLTAA